MQYGPTLEKRRGRANAPKARTRSEQLIHGKRGAAGICAESDNRQPVCDGDADVGAGIVQVGFFLAYVWSLFHELRWQAHGKVLRQLQFRQVERLSRGLIRKS